MDLPRLSPKSHFVATPMPRVRAMLFADQPPCPRARVKVGLESMASKTTMDHFVAASRPRSMDGEAKRRTPALETSLRCGDNARLEGLKSRLLLQRLDQTPEVRLHTLLIRAAHAAAALAQLTAYPTLMFPLLFSEQADAALDWARRQVRIRRQSLDILVSAISYPAREMETPLRSRVPAKSKM